MRLQRVRPDTECLHEPILDAQPGHAAELPLVIGDNDQTERHRLRGDELIHGADPHTGTLEFQAQAGIGWNALPAERQAGERRQEGIRSGYIAFRRTGFERAELQLSLRDRRDGHIRCRPLAQMSQQRLGPAAQGLYANVRVEQPAQGHLNARFWAGGLCRRIGCSGSASA